MSSLLVSLVLRPGSSWCPVRAWILAASVWLQYGFLSRCCYLRQFIYLSSSTIDSLLTVPWQKWSQQFYEIPGCEYHHTRYQFWSYMPSCSELLQRSLLCSSAQVSKFPNLFVTTIWWLSILYATVWIYVFTAVLGLFVIPDNRNEPGWILTVNQELEWKEMQSFLLQQRKYKEVINYLRVYEP